MYTLIIHPPRKREGSRQAEENQSKAVVRAQSLPMFCPGSDVGES